MSYRVVTVTPAGRKRYLEILSHYLLQHRAEIKEHHFWVNTRNQADITFIEALAGRHPDFFKLKRREVWDDDRQCDSIWQYFQEYIDEETIYVRFDDDICYVAPDAIGNITRFRKEHREPFLVLGNVVNNALCSYYQQERGFLPMSWGTVGYECMDAVGWDGRRFAEKLHEKFLRDIHNKATDLWKFPAKRLDEHPRFSINVICWFGRDMGKVPAELLTIPNLLSQPLPHPITGKKIYDEESMLTEHLPALLERPNVICGDALFGHFAFYPQRRYLEEVTTLLDEYRDLTVSENAQARRNRRRLTKAVKPIKALANGNSWRYVQRLVRERLTGEKIDTRYPPL